MHVLTVATMRPASTHRQPDDSIRHHSPCNVSAMSTPGAPERASPQPATARSPWPHFAPPPAIPSAPPPSSPHLHTSPLAPAPLPGSRSPVTSLASLFIKRNETALLSGHANGELRVLKVSDWYTRESPRAQVDKVEEQLVLPLGQQGTAGADGADSTAQQAGEGQAGPAVRQLLTYRKGAMRLSASITEGGLVRIHKQSGAVKHSMQVRRHLVQRCCRLAETQCYDSVLGSMAAPALRPAALAPRYTHATPILNAHACTSFSSSRHNKPKASYTCRPPPSSALLQIPGPVLHAHFSGKHLIAVGSEAAHVVLPVHSNRSVRALPIEALAGATLLAVAPDVAREFKVYAISSRAELLTLVVPTEKSRTACKVVNRVALQMELPHGRASVRLVALRGHLLLAHPGGVALFNVTARGAPEQVMTVSNGDLRSLLGEAGEGGQQGVLPMLVSNDETFLAMLLRPGTLALFRSQLPAHRPQQLWWMKLLRPLLLLVALVIGGLQFVKSRRRMAEGGGRRLGRRGRHGRPALGDGSDDEDGYGDGGFLGGDALALGRYGRAMREMRRRYPHVDLDRVAGTGGPSGLVRGAAAAAVAARGSRGSRSSADGDDETDGRRHTRSSKVRFSETIEEIPAEGEEQVAGEQAVEELGPGVPRVYEEGHEGHHLGSGDDGDDGAGEGQQEE